MGYSQESWSIRVDHGDPSMGRVSLCYSIDRMIQCTGLQINQMPIVADGVGTNVLAFGLHHQLQLHLLFLFFFGFLLLLLLLSV